jgi:dTDP-glucose 4,6-dehydratase
MRLLVTGGLGFIGANFVRHLLKTRRDVSVVNLDKRTYAGNPANLAEFAKDKRYRWIKGDIADAKAVEKAIVGSDAVVNFAAETHVDRSILDASIFIKTNVIGTQVLMDAALRHKTPRFVHVSTDEVYGSIPKGESKEADRLEPNSPYAASKAASDLLVRSYVVTHKLPALITRASNNFGPYQYPEKALPLMITNWIDGQPFPLYGDGLQVRDWLYVADHARAIELVLEKGRVGEIYNVGGAFSCTNKELVESVRALMQIPEELIQPVADRPGHDRRYALDCSKLRGLGFRHEYSFAEALELTIDWYRKHEKWWRPLKKQGGYRSYYKKQYASRAAA